MIIMSKKPVTITINPEHDKKIRQFQAKLISATSSNWSYSKVIEEMLDEGLKSFSIEKIKKKTKN